MNFRLFGSVFVSLSVLSFMWIDLPTCFLFPLLLLSLFLPRRDISFYFFVSSSFKACGFTKGVLRKLKTIFRSGDVGKK